MLVLTRRQGESIRIGEIEVTVLKTHPTRVQIGISAPPHINIVRTEIDGRDNNKTTHIE